MCADCSTCVVKVLPSCQRAKQETDILEKLKDSKNIPEIVHQADNLLILRSVLSDVIWLKPCSMPINI